MTSDEIRAYLHHLLVERQLIWSTCNVTAATIRKVQWVADRQADLLPVPYFHTVFTLPHALNALVLGHKRRLLGLLFTVASQTLLQFGRHNLGGQLGGIMVLHTWDQLLNAHFHVHCLVSGGALADDGTRWVPTHPAFLFPVKALGTVVVSQFEGKPSKRHSRASGNPAKAVSAALELDASLRWHDVQC